MIRLRLAAFAIVTLAAGCGGHQRCFGRGVPRVGVPGADEAYGLLHRERARARNASPLVAARITETLPGLVPDASDRVDEPRCSDELVSDATAALDRRPVVFSRALVAQLRAAGRARDVVGVMDAKAAFLIAAATLRDDELTAYQLAPGEPGPAPAKALVRYLALAALGHSNVFLNVPAARTFVRERMRVTTDDRELLLLAAHVREAFDRSRRNMRDNRVPDGDPILRRWIADVRARLARAPDPIALEAVLLRLDILGQSAAARGLTDEVRPLLDEIIAARGRFAATGGVAGAEHDLLRAAAAARHDLDQPRRYHERAIAPQRAVFDLRRDWLDREPAGGEPTPAERHARLTELEGELSHVTRSVSRCAVLSLIPSWVPTDAADRTFDALTSGVFRGTTIHTSAETTCRIRAALAIEGVSADRRARFLVRMLRPTDATSYDSHDDDGGAYSPGEAGIIRYIATTAAAVLAAHPAWLDASPPLQQRVVELAREPLGTDASHDELRMTLQPAFEHLLGRGHPESRAILETWIATIRPIPARDDLGYVWVYEAASARLAALAVYARRHGLDAEARALFTEILATPLPSPRQAYVHPALLRAAALALIHLDGP